MFNWTKYITTLALSILLLVQFGPFSANSCKIPNQKEKKTESLHCSMENTKPMSCCSKETVQKKQETPIDSDCMFSCDCSLSVATVEQKNYVSITEIHLEAPKLLIVFEQVFESDSSIELIVFENPPDKFGSQTPIYKKNAVFLI